jgi:polyhydroxybutyrate depolymerase
MFQYFMETQMIGSLYRSLTHRVILGFAALLAGVAVASAAAAADPSGQVTVGSTVRSFTLHVPDGPRPPGGFPLVLAFHGGGQQGPAMRRLSGLDAVADSRRFIVAYPNGIDKHWNDGRSTIRNPQNDVGFVSALIDQVQRSYGIDSKRVYATGISNGALFAERLGCDLSRRIAAIAPVAGTLPSDIAAKCRPERPVAVLQIDGTADPIMPFKGGDVADFGGAGEGGKVLSVRDTAAFWARTNGCALPGKSAPLAPTARPDSTRVVATRYDGCRPSGAVEVLTVTGGGHTWPGGVQYARRLFVGVTSRQIDASRSIADFFLSQPPR